MTDTDRTPYRVVPLEVYSKFKLFFPDFLIVWNIYWNGFEQIKYL